jgi:putative nucleotidyltransferase with HDIG domain
VKQKVAVEDLRIGMYVAELDRPWRETPFLFQGFEIRSEEDLAKLRQHCRHVIVESREEVTVKPKSFAPPPRGPGVSAEPPARAAAPHAKASDYNVLQRFQPGARHAPRYADDVSLEQELPQARELVTRVHEVVATTMEDVRLGRSLDAPTARKYVGEMVGSIIRNPDALVWLNELKHKDSYTLEHSVRVCVLALAFGRHLELPAEELQVLGLGALLHDVGKMKVPNEILNKPGRLTEQEFEIMKSHVPQGVTILEGTRQIPEAAIEVARCHHERFNGGGYAGGLRGETIGLFGAVGAIVDCYDAITSDRVYHNGMAAHEALGKMYAWRQTDFHPGLVEQFIQCMGVFPIGSIVELSTGAVGVVVAQHRTRRLRPRVALVLNTDKKPFDQAKIVDLMDVGIHDLEIRNCLPSGSFGINPTEYLRLVG